MNTTATAAAKVRKAIVKANPSVTVHEVFAHEGRFIIQFTTETFSHDMYVPTTPARAAAAVTAYLATR